MMGRHRGRSRPFTARRPYYPRHCDSPVCRAIGRGAPIPELLFHVVRTVAPK